MTDVMIGPVTMLRDRTKGKGYAATCPCGWWTGWALGLGATAAGARDHAALCGGRYVSWEKRYA